MIREKVHAKVNACVFFVGHCQFELVVTVVVMAKAVVVVVMVATVLE